MMSLFTVNEDNIVQCFDLWHKSSISQFIQVFQRTPGGGGSASITAAQEVTMRGLLKELKAVVNCYGLGVQLDISTSELDKIQLDYPNVELCKMQMLKVWQDMKEGSWSDIVRALVNIGKKTLAARIAKRYGVPLPQPSNRNSIGSDAVVENGNQVQSEVVSRIKQLEKGAESQEKKLLEKDLVQHISHLKAGLRRAENKVFSTNREHVMQKMGQ